MPEASEQSEKNPVRVVFTQIEVPIPSLDRFDDPCEFIQINARDRIIGHVIEDSGKNGEGDSLIGMPLANRLNDGCQGTDARGLSLWSLQG